MFAGTPLGLNDDVSFTTKLTGSYRMNRSAQVGTSIDFTITDALFHGVLPAFLGGNAFQLTNTPGTTSAGTITDVVQDPGDPGFSSGAASSFVSGNYRTETYYSMFVPDTGATFYTDLSDPSVFTATPDALPFAPGMVKPAMIPVGLSLQVGASPDSSVDVLVGRVPGSLTIVPEPSALALTGIGALGVVGLIGHRRRSRRRPLA